MISGKEYFHHLEDIAELKRVPLPLSETLQNYLKELEAEAEEFEKERPEEANRLRDIFRS